VAAIFPLPITIAEVLLKAVIFTGVKVRFAPEVLQVAPLSLEVTTSVDSFETVRKAIVDAGLEIENASLQWIAKNTIEVEGEASEKVEKLFDMLDDSDDVQNVYSNADFKE